MICYTERGIVKLERGDYWFSSGLVFGPILFNIFGGDLSARPR